MMKLLLQHKLFFLFVVIGLAIRLSLIFLPGFKFDITAWYAWAIRLNEVGLNNFYSNQIWTNYTPGYLYILSFLGFLNQALHLDSNIFYAVLKIPPILIDLILAGFIYWLIQKEGQKKLALIGASLILFNPAIIINSSLWGQIDSILTIFLMLSIYFLSKQKIWLAGLMFGLAILIKPQALALAPAIGLYFLTNFAVNKLVRFLSFTFVTIIAFAIPFFSQNPITQTFDLFTKMVGDYPYNSLFAFNFWGVFGFWVKDDRLFLGLSYQMIGLLLYVIFWLVVLFFFYQKRIIFQGKNHLQNLTVLSGLAAIACLSFYFLPTRVHDRYLYSALPFLILTAFYLRSKIIGLLTILLSFIHLLNLYYVYVYYNEVFENGQKLLYLDWFYLGIEKSASFLSGLATLTFGLIVIFIIKKLPNYKAEKAAPKQTVLLTSKIVPHQIVKFINQHKLLILILILTAALRFYRLDFPQTYAFDEVYHAFTAKEFLMGHKEAWEWWTQPPEGVAYEWTHPPLAKEFMAMSMWTFQSMEPWAWRTVGVLFGITSVWLIYQLAKTLFNSDRVGLISAFVFSIDGLNFVQSRIGMNDVYVVTFCLASLLLFVKKKYILSAIFLGLALASKWSAVYLLGLYICLIPYYLGNYSSWLKKHLYIIYSLIFYPVLAFIAWRITYPPDPNAVAVIPDPESMQIKILTYLDQTLSQESVVYYLLTFLGILMLLFKKIRTPLAFIFFPVLIYILAYLPFFQLGHSFSEFVGLQKQMWWYHTNLKATHTYASPWWSWPLNLYPVWYYVQYFDNKIAVIFNSGNPLVFWMGLSALIITLIEFLQKRTFALAIIILGYLVFLLPWAISPRIMFLYHYAPSLPFLSLALGYQLHRLSQRYLLGILALFFIAFMLFYPVLTAIPLPKDQLLLFFRTNATKNPF